MVVGGIIGSGIFLNPAVVAQRVGTPALTLIAWTLGAFVAMLGAFVFAELGARAPNAGGGYAYLRDALGPLPAFLYGWALLLAIATGATAAVAVTFANYAVPLVGLPAGSEKLLAIGAILTFSAINIVGVAPGAWVQNAFTVLKLAAIGLLVFAGLSAAPASLDIVGSAGADAGTLSGLSSVSSGFLPISIALGTALVPVLFSYGGWQQTNFIAEELINPEKNLPRALVTGVAIVGVTYLLANMTYLKVLGVEGLAASSAPAADVMQARFGNVGRGLIAAGIAISTAGFLNVVILVTPRVYQAMARDGLFFRSLARLNPRTKTPVAAILLQALWAVVLVMSGSYGDLLGWVTFADWIFFGATAATLFVYRRREDVSAKKLFRTPFHPLSTGLFILAALYVVLGAIISNPWNAIRGTFVLMLGVPVFYWWNRRRDTNESAKP